MTSQAHPPQFTSPEFRSALGMFPTGVTIVTARSPDGSFVGLTASSFNSVSENPPLVLWSLALKSRSMPAFSAGSHYAINVLAAEQRHLAERFASPVSNRFEGLNFRLGASGAPVFDGSAAVFECFNRHQYAGGDHLIFVGEVEYCWRREAATPLIYHRGQFFTEMPL